MTYFYDLTRCPALGRMTFLFLRFSYKKCMGNIGKSGFLALFHKKTALNGYKNPNDRLCGTKPTLFETLD